MSYFDDVCVFMRAVGQEVRTTPSINLEAKELRLSLVREEVAELMTAIRYDDLVEIADGIADVIVVALGTAAAYGIPFEKVWQAVRESNMAKVEGGVRFRDDGKLLKPEGWTAPDIAGVLG